MKKFLCGIMCAAFLVSNQAISFAQDVETKIQSENSVEQTELTKEMIENKIQELQSEFGLTYEFLDDTTRNSNSIDLHFDTLEEYEAFIREISQTRVFKVESAEKSDSPNLTRSEIDYLRLEKDEVWLDTIARGYIPRVDVQYTWRYSNGNPVFDEVLEIYPWISGINFGEWNTHFTSYDLFENFARYDGIDIEVVGSITLNIGIGSFGIGHSIPVDFTISGTI